MYISVKQVFLEYIFLCFHQYMHFYVYFAPAYSHYLAEELHCRIWRSVNLEGWLCFGSCNVLESVGFGRFDPIPNQQPFCLAATEREMDQQT